jgi:hypothetical protein
MAQMPLPNRRLTLAAVLSDVWRNTGRPRRLGDLARPDVDSGVDHLRDQDCTGPTHRDESRGKFIWKQGLGEDVRSPDENCEPSKK